MNKPFLLMGFILLCSFFLNSSCNHDNDPAPASTWTFSDPNTIVNSLEVSKITYDNGEMNFIFDNEGKVKGAVENLTIVNVDRNVTTRRTTSTNHDLVYSNGALASVNFSIQTEITKTYDNGRKTDEPTSNSTGTVIYEYNEKNHVSKIIIKKYNAEGKQVEKREVIREYDKNDQPVKATHYIDGTPQYLFIVEWTGGNVSRKLNYTRSDTLYLNSEITLSKFDNKNNPLAILAVLDGSLNEACISKNNFSEMISNPESTPNSYSPPVKSTVRLEYDGRNRLTKLNFTHNSGESEGVSNNSFTLTYRN